MTAVSNDPYWWPQINFNINFSYYIAASSAAVLYDWALTIGQEFELVWGHHWSLITVLYIGLRYIGIVYIVINMLQLLPTVSVTDEVRVSEILNTSSSVQHTDCNSCNVMYFTVNWMSVVTNAMLGVIMITRLYAMYQKSRNMLIFLVVFFTSVTIACGVMTGMLNKYTIGGELILSGTYMCYPYDPEADTAILLPMTWILSTVWEVLALCLAVWIVVKHFRELQQSPTGWVVRDYFTVLMRTHVVYFASFVAVSCLNLGLLFPSLDSLAVGPQIYFGIRQVLSVMQLFVLGPRLILGVRQHHAKVVDNSDAGVDMIPMSFQQRTHLSTGSGV
ncbi:uncharacterized protein HD556DRAFT_1488240 [Suillus plorans]|uniref:DUF6533 domain-containing protein n=1 Tax=Suillus plorans TaxID=116603 RepID=A0A9P7DFE2_9AGAM|nr:uncharacterized protein HD556DRAFT_1488240 [Suillus plorans]KAG1790640.1 hypothetical protein HD556DRAFT_1488240 [Suillus plorans]